MKKVTLPDEIFLWILHSGWCFPRKDADFSYTVNSMRRTKGRFETCLCQITQGTLFLIILGSFYADKYMKYAEDHTHRLVQLSVMDELFRQLGAKAEAVDVRQTAVPEPMQAKGEQFMHSASATILTKVERQTWKTGQA